MEEEHFQIIAGGFLQINVTRYVINRENLVESEMVEVEGLGSYFLEYESNTERGRDILVIR